MGSYYKNAVCTIAATGAQGSYEGLFLERPGSTIELSPYKFTKRVSESPKEYIISPSIPSWSASVEEGPCIPEAGLYRSV
jgi:hypothetical protein